MMQIGSHDHDSILSKMLRSCSTVMLLSASSRSLLNTVMQAIQDNGSSEEKNIVRLRSASSVSVSSCASLSSALSRFFVTA